MEDIVRYKLILITPLDFLNVAKWTRMAALKLLPSLRIDCESRDYYRIVQMLGENGMNDGIAQFVTLNYDELQFRLAIMSRVVDATHFKWHKWCHLDQQNKGRVGLELKLDQSDINIVEMANIQDSMVFSAMDTMHIIDPNEVCKWIDQSYFNTDRKAVITNMLDFYFYDNGCEIFNDDLWNEELATRTVRFVMKYFPDYIDQYIDMFIEEGFEFDPYNLRLANGSLRCLETVLKLAAGSYDAERLPDFWRYIWRYRMCDVCFEYRDELYGEIKHKTPLFNRLRRITNTRMDQWRRFMSVRWQILQKSSERGERGFMPRRCLYLTLHVGEDTDDEEFSDDEFDDGIMDFDNVYIEDNDVDYATWVQLV